jgi:hypothetical protein
MSEIRQWLAPLGLDQYADVITDRGVDVGALHLLTDTVRVDLHRTPALTGPR